MILPPGRLSFWLIVVIVAVAAFVRTYQYDGVVFWLFFAGYGIVFFLALSALYVLLGYLIIGDFYLWLRRKTKLSADAAQNLVECLVLALCVPVFLAFDSFVAEITAKYLL